MYESVQSFLQQREKERKKEGVYTQIRRTVLRKKRKRISRVAITRVPTHPLLLLLLLLSLSLPSSSSSRCPFVVRPRRRSPFPRGGHFSLWREKKRVKEKDEKCVKQKKNCRRHEKKKRGRFFSTVHPFFVLSFPTVSVKERALTSIVAPKHRFFSSFCASSFFACIYLETRDLDAFHSRDET